MASYKNYSQKRRAQANWEYDNMDSANSYDPIKDEKIDYDHTIDIMLTSLLLIF